MSLRVLIWMIADGNRIPGGHKVQLEQTARHLRTLGVDCVISSEESPSLENFDLVHGFGIGPTELRRVRERNIGILVSTIYWSRDYTEGRLSVGRGDFLRQIPIRGRAGIALLGSALRGRHIEKCEAFTERANRARVTYEMADLLLPNSVSEGRAAVEELGVTTPFHFVPNGVNADQYPASLVSEASLSKREYILYTGRFEPHKNQLGLIQAMRNTGIPVVLTGFPHPDHAAYYEKCKQAATDNIKILPPVSNEELPGLYGGAKVHVLPSWFETTGLVSLEAALSGCNIVTTNRGYASDYFLDMAWYCDPADPASIRQAVKDAYQAPFRADLREHVLNNFTWRHTAQATLAGYERVLARGQKSPVSASVAQRA